MFDIFENKELHLHGAGDTYFLENKLKLVFGKKFCLLTNSATASHEVICHSRGIYEKNIYTSPYQWPGMLLPLITRKNKLFLGNYGKRLSLKVPDKPGMDVLFVVDSFGKAHEHQREFSEYCKKNHSLYVTDASSSMGTLTSEGVPTGKYSDFVITSFGPHKPFFGGEGGAVLTDNEEWFEEMVLFATHPYRHLAEGYVPNFYAHNLRMNPFGITYLNSSFDSSYAALKQKQLDYFTLYQHLLETHVVDEMTPLYTSENSTFSPFVVELKKDFIIPDYLVFGKQQIRPVTFYPLPKNAGKFLPYEPMHCNDNLKLVSLEIKNDKKKVKQHDLN